MPGMLWFLVGVAILSLVAGLSAWPKIMDSGFAAIMLTVDALILVTHIGPAIETAEDGWEAFLLVTIFCLSPLLSFGVGILSRWGWERYRNRFTFASDT